MDGISWVDVESKPGSHLLLLLLLLLLSDE
jgi:hypothetical protein